MSTPPTSTSETPGLDLRGAARRALFFTAALAIVAVALGSLPGLGEVRERFASAAPAWLAAALILELASTASFPVALRGAFSKIMPWRPAFALGLVETGANVLVPAGGSGGLAFGALLLQRRGVPTAFVATRTVVLFLATSLVTFLAIIVSGTAIALGADGGDIPAYAGALVAAGAAAFLVAVCLIGRLPASVAEQPGRLRSLIARLRDWLTDGVRATIELLRRGDVLVVVGSVGYLRSTSPRSPRYSRPSAAARPLLPPSSWPSRSARPAR